MRSAGNRSLAVVIVALCIGTLSLKTSANDMKIIPGERIGDASLSMSIDRVLKTLGAPSRVERAEEMATYEWSSQQIRVFQSLDTGIITNIRTYWKPSGGKATGGATIPIPYKTEKGIGIGANPEQVRQAYGDAGCSARDHASPRGDFRELSWAELGLFFFVATDPRYPAEIANKVREIGVRRKGAQARASGAEYKPCP